MRTNDIDWKKVRNEYIYSPSRPTYADLSETYQISEAAIAKHGASGSWVKLRKENESVVEANAFEDKLVEEIIGQLELEQSATLACKTLTDAIIKIASRVDRADFIRDLDEVEASQLLRVLSNITNSTERIIKVISLLKGGPTERTDNTLADILSEQFELESV